MTTTAEVFGKLADTRMRNHRHFDTIDPEP
jgi:hypothetical protein